MTMPFTAPAGQFPALQQPGAAGQPGMHMTVPYGLPGAPPAVVLPPNQPVPQGGGWGQPAPQPAQQWGQPGAGQPGAAPTPQSMQLPQPSGSPTFAGPVGQPPYQPQPQPQPQPAQGQPGARYDIPDHVVLDGPGIPPEMRGRTFGQMKQIYGALASDFISRQPGRPAQPQPGVGGPVPQGPPRGPQGQPVYVQGQPHGGQPQPQGQGQDEVRAFWENPAQFIRSAVREEAATVMGPTVERSHAQAVQEARSIAASGIPDFQMLEPDMMQMLTQADARSLTDPRLWISTADLVRGRMMSQGRYDPRWQNRQPQPQPQPGSNFHQGGPGVAVPAPMAPIPQVPQPQMFFTEQPTPPQAGYGWPGAPMQGTLTPDEQMYARKMNMTDQEYIGWRGGVQPTAQARRW